MEKMAAILPSDKPYMKTTVGETYRKRIPWLLLLEKYDLSDSMVYCSETKEITSYEEYCVIKQKK